jgi:conserved oligomeric Golgi complex subunit 6
LVVNLKDLNSLKEIISLLSDKTRVIKRENEFLENILKIEKEIKETKEKEILFSNFISTFQLTNEEKEIIMSGEINHNFFEVFEKMNQIQLECTKMLRNQYKSGIDIMDQVRNKKLTSQMSIYQDTCFERLSRWIQSSEKKGEMEFKRGLKYLSDRPALYRHCLKDMIQGRKSELWKRFIHALSGKKNPMEMNSHDPILFISDLLTWLHQDCASEKESLEIEDVNILNEIYDSILSHLKSRMEPFFKVEKIENQFNLFHLFDLYEDKMNDLLGLDNLISIFLKNFKMEKLNLFVSQQEKQQGMVVELTNDFSPPKILIKNINLLLSIMKTYAIVEESKKKKDFQMLKKLLLEPILKEMEKIHSLPFLINSFHIIQHLLMELEDMEEEEEEEKSKLNQFIELFIQMESRDILEKNGLGILLKEEWSEEKTITSIRSFYSFLFSLGSNFFISNLERIQSVKLQSYIRNRICHELHHSYEVCYQEIQNRFKNAEEIAFHTPKKVKILLDV